MPTITIKGLPLDLHRALKKRARTHQRSLNREVIATLQSAARDPRVLEPTDLIAEARAARKKFKGRVTARQIDAWKRQGRL